MTDKLDGQVLYASEFNAKADKADLDGKQDKITANSSLTLENLTANNELEANKLRINKIIPSTAQQINLSTAELKAIKSIELNDGTNNVIISPSADGVTFSKTLKVNTPSGDKDAANKLYVDTKTAKKQDTIKSTDTLTIAGLRASDNSMTLFNDSCVVSMTDDALIINFI